MKDLRIITIVCSCLLSLCGCSNEAERNGSAALVRPLPVTMSYQKQIVSDIAQRPIMKKTDLSNAVVRSKEDFIKLFDNPEELANIKIRDFKTENPQMNGKIFTAVQKIRNVTVYGSFVKVRTFANGLIHSVECIFSENGRKLDCSAKTFSEELKKKIFHDKKNWNISKPVTLIYDPVLVDDQGEAALVWMIDIDDGQMQAQRYFISQKDGRVIVKLPLNAWDLKKTAE